MRVENVGRLQMTWGEAQRCAKVGEADALIAVIAREVRFV